MSDTMDDAGLSRKAGRGFLRALRGLFGKQRVKKAAESVEALKEEFEAGRQEAEGEDPETRSIEHRVVDED